MKANTLSTEPVQGVLVRMAERLTADQLRALPPLSIPRGVLDTVVDPRKRAELRRLDERKRMPDGVTEPTAARAELDDAALAAAENVDAAAAGVLCERVRLFKSTVRQSQYKNHWLAEWSEELDALRELASELGAAVSGVAALRQTLTESANGSGDRRERIAAALERLPEAGRRFEEALCEYQRLEIGLACDAMRARRAECELEARKYQEVTDKVEELDARLRGGRWGLGRLLPRGRAARRERERLAERRERLAERQQRHHVFIESGEVRSWLNTLVEAGAYLPYKQWLSETLEARRLYYQLLNVHCLQTTTPARDLAVNVIRRGDSLEALDYCTLSDRYLHNYFANRTAKAAADANTVARIRDSMIAEYREQAGNSN